MDIKAQIKARLKIEDIIGRTVELKRHGNYLTGFCPFHQNTNTPAFVVWPSSQTWRCFGACGEGGDIFSFVMKRDNLSFEAALDALASEANLSKNDHQSPATDHRPSPSKIQNLKSKIQNRLSVDRQPRQADWQSSLFSLCDRFAANLFTKAGERARCWLNQRGLADATLKRFRIGFNPASSMDRTTSTAGLPFPTTTGPNRRSGGSKFASPRRDSPSGCSIGSATIQANPYPRNCPSMSV